MFAPLVVHVIASGGALPPEAISHTTRRLPRRQRTAARNDIMNL